MSQQGKIYVKGNRWYFRYQEPVVANGQRSWRDRYLNLAPREAFSSAAAVEKDCRQIINDALNKAATMTADTMQPVNDFIEHIYFPGRKDDLRRSTLVGYKNLHARHLKKLFEGLRLCDFKLQLAQDILNRIARESWAIVSNDEALQMVQRVRVQLGCPARCFQSRGKKPVFSCGDPENAAAPQRADATRKPRRRARHD